MDDRKTSQSIRPFPNFEMLDTKIASTLKKIIMNTGGAKGTNTRPISQWKTDDVHGL